MKKKQVKMAMNSATPRHPGRILEKEMKAQGLSQKKLATILGISSSQLSEIFRGKRNITASFAVKLELLWDSVAEYWNNLQANYNLECAKIEAYIHSSDPNEFSIDESAIIANYTPKKFFKEQGFLKGNVNEDRNFLLKLFGVDKIVGIKDLFLQDQKHLSFFRSSQKLEKDKVNGFAWERLVRFRACKKSVSGGFDTEMKDQLVEVLNRLFWSHSGDNTINVIQETEKILSDFGILFLIQPKPAKCPIDGYAFMCGDTRAIAMTIRYKRLDNFAFTLLHELGHVFEDLEENGELLPIDDLSAKDGERGEIEKKADQFAKDALISPEDWKDFSYIKKSDSSILHFAARVKIHPGILRGRLCSEKPSFYKRRTSINAMNKLVVQ